MCPPGVACENRTVIVLRGECRAESGSSAGSADGVSRLNERRTKKSDNIHNSDRAPPALSFVPDLSPFKIHSQRTNYLPVRPSLLSSSLDLQPAAA